MRLIVALSFIFAATGCASADLSNDVVRKLASLKPGISSRIDVVRLMGSPEGEEDLFKNENRLLYGVRISSNIKVPQIIVGINSVSQKVTWASYINFDQKLNLNQINSLYPNAKFLRQPSNPKQYRDYISTDQSFSDNALGVFYSLRTNDDVKSIGWGIPSLLSHQNLDHKVTSKNN